MQRGGALEVEKVGDMTWEKRGGISSGENGESSVEGG